MIHSCIIVEDEVPSADRLEKMVLSRKDLHVKAKLNSVKGVTDWLAENKMPDLIFLDIQLSDGTGLDVLTGMNEFPCVIFTTAYDQYVLDAFKFNSVDYLLKPIKSEELERAIEKFQRIKQSPDISGLMDQLQSKLGSNYKSKFLVRIGQRYHSIQSEDAAYFFSESGSSFLMDKAGKKFILDQSLDQLEKQLNPTNFFRINRQMIVTFKSITSIDTFFNNRLILQLQPNHDSDVLVSREKVRAFKDWLDN